jgi:hypothetical protein
MPESKPAKKLLTLKHAAERVDKTVPSLRWLIRTGRLPTKKIFDRHMISPEALDRVFGVPDDAA